MRYVYIKKYYPEDHWAPIGGLTVNKSYECDCIIMSTKKEMWKVSDDKNQERFFPGEIFRQYFVSIRTYRKQKVKKLIE